MTKTIHLCTTGSIHKYKRMLSEIPPCDVHERTLVYKVSPLLNCNQRKFRLQLSIGIYFLNHYSKEWCNNCQNIIKPIAEEKVMLVKEIRRKGCNFKLSLLMYTLIVHKQFPEDISKTQQCFVHSYFLTFQLYYDARSLNYSSVLIPRETQKHWFRSELVMLYLISHTRTHTHNLAPKQTSYSWTTLDGEKKKDK